MKIAIIFFIVLHQRGDVSCGWSDDIAGVIGTFSNLADNVVQFVKHSIHRILDIKGEPERMSAHTHRTLRTIATLRNEADNYNSKNTVLKTTDFLIKSLGKEAEIHSVRTEDGYYLVIHRIPLLEQANSRNRSVLLHHGILGSSADWMLLENKSLPCLLSADGYDVWLTNARGNFYSNKHDNFTVDSLEFWNFSWQEMGQYDLPAVIDYIRNNTGSDEKIDFIGHSLGTSALMVMLSTKPDYSRYLRMGILLAPLVFMKNAKGPLRVLSCARGPKEVIMTLLGKGEFLPKRTLPRMLLKDRCKQPNIFCDNPLFFLAGGLQNHSKYNTSFVHNILYHVPSSTSTQTIMHYAQIVKSGKFHKYNDVKTEFPVTNVSLPLALFSSDIDMLARESDVMKLLISIGNTITHFTIPGISHTEFVWGLNADKRVFNMVISILLDSPHYEKLRNEV